MSTISTLWTIVILLCIFTAMLMLSMYLFNQQQQEQHEHVVKLLTKHIEDILEQHNKPLLDIREGLIQQLQTQREAIVNNPGLHFKQKQSALLKMYEQELLLSPQGEPEAFFKKINQQLHQFETRLSTVHPSLNERERMLCCLYLLEVHDTDIIDLSGYAPRSLPNIKHRLTKKMGLTSVSELSAELLKVLCSL